MLLVVLFVGLTMAIEKINDSFFQPAVLREKRAPYIIRGKQGMLFDDLDTESPTPIALNQTTERYYVPRCYYTQNTENKYFQIQSRRYLGNKFKLLKFIEDIVSTQCGEVRSFCDIFAGTGVVGHRFNRNIKIISNDFLLSNHVCLQTFLGTDQDVREGVAEKIRHCNNVPNDRENYFSHHFGGTYFTEENARKIGAMREEIDRIAENNHERYILICSLIYAADKVANTVGHYDAFRRTLDMLNPIELRVPDVDYACNANNRIYREDANTLIRKISCDVLYIDPPYNSRQYSDAYHLIENLAEWNKPEVTGIGKKMDRSYIKSNYCLKGAIHAFTDLIKHADCKHILLSYNNTGDSKNGRSNARMRDEAILDILQDKGDVMTFERAYNAFTTGKSKVGGNSERIFHCKVKGNS